MSLSTLLAALGDDPQGQKLLEQGGAAFVSRSIRPYTIAAMVNADAARPAVVVAGDDREAQALASVNWRIDWRVN